MVDADATIDAADFDFYDVLNLSRDASTEDIRSSFRELSRVYHPDKQVGTDGGGAHAFMRVHHAYRVLGDETLRKFYDRYGPAGVRLAESLSDEEGDEANGCARALSIPEDRLRSLEGRVQAVVRRHQEMKMQRLLALQGSFTLAVSGGPPGQHSAFLRRRYRLQYSAVTQSVQIALGGRVRMSVGCAMHVQGSNGLGASKLTVGAFSPLGSLTTLRGGVSFAGASPQMEVALARNVTPDCMVQQKVSATADGGTMTLSVQPKLTKTLRGNISGSCGEEPCLSMGLVRKSASSGHKVAAQLSFHPEGNAELGGVLKYKPDKRFSLKLLPAITTRGWVLQATCSKTFRDKLTKLQWNIRLRRQGVSLKLTLCRSGLRFALPLELWPEAAGPLPARELGLALALWVLPPLGLRCLRAVGLAIWPLLRCKPDSQDSDAAAAAAAAAADARKAAAEEQRRLVAREAERCRRIEVACKGLEILAALYGDRDGVAAHSGGGGGGGASRGSGSALVAEGAVAEASAVAASTEAAAPTAAVAATIVDVTEALMAKVRDSRLQISDAPKSSLLGFCDPRPAAPSPSPAAAAAAATGTANAATIAERRRLALYIRYRFGGVVHERTFADNDPVLLP